MVTPLTANVVKQRYRSGAYDQYQDFEIANAAQLYVGGIGALDANGRLIENLGANGTKVVGRIVAGALTPSSTTSPTATSYLLGNTGLTPPPRASVFIGSEILEKLVVTGLPATMASNLALVWVANGSDNYNLDLTLTCPALGVQPYGFILNTYGTQQIADVQVFSLAEREAMTPNAGAPVTVHFSHVEAATGGPLTVAASIFGDLMPAPFHGKVTGCYAYSTSTMTGGPVTVNPAINGVTTTGGNMVLTLTLAGKTKITGTAITGANEFHVGDTLDLITTTVTNFTGGGVDFYLTLTPLPGA